MRAYLVAHLFLAPFLVFTVLAPLGYPLLGAGLGSLIGIVACATRYGMRLPPIFMTAQVVGVIVVFVLLLTNPELKENAALAILFAFLASGAIMSVLQFKPWTIELSAADVGEFASNPAFIKANVFFSGMWAVIFAWFAYANFMELIPLFRWIPMIAGGVITILGPKILTRLAIKRGLMQ